MRAWAAGIPYIISSQGNRILSHPWGRPCCLTSPGYPWKESLEFRRWASHHARGVLPSLYRYIYTSLPSRLRDLSSYRASGAPALAGEVDGTGWRRRRWRVIVLVHSRDEVIWSFCFRVQGVGEEEGDVLAERCVCEEGWPASWDGEGDGCGCLGRHLCVFWGLVEVRTRSWVA